MGFILARKLLKCTHRNVFKNRKFGKRLRDLEGANHTKTCNIVYRHAHNVLSQQFDLTTIDWMETCNGCKQCCFASAIRANQRNDLACTNFKGSVVNGAQAAKYFG